MEAEEALRERGKTLVVPKVRYSYCIECGESMPEVRQAHGFDNCVDCAEAAEAAEAAERGIHRAPVRRRT